MFALVGLLVSSLKKMILPSGTIFYKLHSGTGERQGLTHKISSAASYQSCAYKVKRRARKASRGRSVYVLCSDAIVEKAEAVVGTKLGIGMFMSRESWRKPSTGAK
jgi:hypothetical protein